MTSCDALIYESGSSTYFWYLVDQVSNILGSFIISSIICVAKVDFGCKCHLPYIIPYIMLSYHTSYPISQSGTQLILLSYSKKIKQRKSKEQIDLTLNLNFFIIQHHTVII